MHKSQRLVQMIMRINAKKSFTAQELADEFNVSVRTVTRDLQELSEFGVPVYSVQGRGGGYRLLRERTLPPISFTEGEAIALFFASQSLKHLGAHPFEDSADAGLTKFYHYLPADTRERIDRLQHKVAIWSPHRYMVTEDLKTLLKSIMKRQVVTIVYRAEHGSTERDVQPVGLFAHNGYWYCPGYCFLREEMRLFRADRITSARLNESVPWRDELDHYHLWNTEPKDRTHAVTMRVELTARGVRSLESDERIGPSITRHDDGGGTASFAIGANDVPFYADRMWQLGEDVVVKAPNEAIEYIRRKIRTMRRLYEE